MLPVTAGRQGSWHRPPRGAVGVAVPRLGGRPPWISPPEEQPSRGMDPRLTWESVEALVAEQRRRAESRRAGRPKPRLEQGLAGRAGDGWAPPPGAGNPRPEPREPGGGRARGGGS